MYQTKSPLQTQLAAPSQPTAPAGKKPAAGIPGVSSRTSMPQRQSTLSTALHGTATPQAVPNYSNVEQQAEQAFNSSVENSPLRQALGVHQRQGIAAMQGVQQRLAQPVAPQTLTGSLSGFGDRMATRDMTGVGMMGNQRNGAFNTGNTAYASGGLAEALAPRQSSFDALRRDAIIAKMNDPNTPDGAAALQSRNNLMSNQGKFGNRLGQSPEQQALYSKYQDGRESRLAAALGIRREIGQQREAARQQAMVEQARAQQSPLNSQLFQHLAMSKPEVAASLMGAAMNNQTDLQRLLLGDRTEQARLALQRESMTYQSPLQVAQAEAARADAEKSRLANQLLGDPNTMQRTRLSDERDLLIGGPQSPQTQARVRQIDQEIAAINSPKASPLSAALSAPIVPDETGAILDEQVDRRMRELYTNRGLKGSQLQQELEKEVGRERLMQFVEENRHGAGAWMGDKLSWLFSIPGNFSSESKRIERNGAPIRSLQDALGM